MTEIFRIVNIEREDRLIYLITRTNKGERKTFKVIDWYPSMFIKRGVDVPGKYTHRIYKRVTGEWKSLDGIPMDKVYTKLPDDVAMIRKALPLEDTGEADVIYTTNFLTHLKIRSGYFILTKPGTVAHADRLHGEISYKEIIPFETNIQIPIREIELDIESVDNQSVLIGFWDSFTDEFYFVGWHKKDSRADISSTKDLNKENITRNIYILPHPRDYLNVAFNMIKKLQPDVLAGWNIVGYDIPMLWKEARHYSINFAQLSPFGSAPAPEKIKGLTIFDMYNGYLRITAKQLRSYKLVNIMKTEYGKTIAHDPRNIPVMWKENFQELIDYNTTHVDACRYISKKIDVLEFIYQIVYTCCCRFDDANMPSRLIDALLLSVKSKNVVLPNKPRGYEKDKEAQGAVVIEPVPGLYDEYTLIVDASRLYPSIFLTFNFGTDTLDPSGNIKIKVRTPSGKVREIVKYSDKKTSEISQAFLFLFELRNKYEKEASETKDIKIKAVLKKKIFAVKIVTNAIYGLVGNPGFRLYKQIIQECVTQVARDVLTWMQEKSQDEELLDVIMIKPKIISGDTDSLHLNLKAKSLEDAVSKGKEIVKYINNSFEDFVKLYGVKKNTYLKIKLEGVTETAFYKAKKRYAHKIIWDGEKLEKPEYKIVGLEPRRSDNPELTGKVTMRVLKKILNKKSKNNIKRYVTKVITKMENGKYKPFDIAIPKAIQKPLNRYFDGKCRISKVDESGCGNIQTGVLPFTQKKEYKNKPETCPKCGKKMTYTKPIHAFSADYSNAYLGTNFKVGDKVRYLYVSDTGDHPETHVIAIDEDLIIPKDIIVNMDKQIQKVVTEKVVPLLEAIDIDLGIEQKKEEKEKKVVKKISSKIKTQSTEDTKRLLADFARIASGESRSKQTTL